MAVWTVISSDGDHQDARAAMPPNDPTSHLLLTEPCFGTFERVAWESRGASKLRAAWLRTFR
jgi:hypothetical protein